MPRIGYDYEGMEVLLRNIQKMEDDLQSEAMEKPLKAIDRQILDKVGPLGQKHQRTGNMQKWLYSEGPIKDEGTAIKSLYTGYQIRDTPGGRLTPGAHSLWITYGTRPHEIPQPKEHRTLKHPGYRGDTQMESILYGSQKTKIVNQEIKKALQEFMSGLGDGVK